MLHAKHWVGVLGYIYTTHNINKPLYIQSAPKPHQRFVVYCSLTSSNTFLIRPKTRKPTGLYNFAYNLRLVHSHNFFMLFDVYFSPAKQNHQHVFVGLVALGPAGKYPALSKLLAGPYCKRRIRGSLECIRYINFYRAMLRRARLCHSK